MKTRPNLALRITMTCLCLQAVICLLVGTAMNLTDSVVLQSSGVVIIASGFLCLQVLIIRPYQCNEPIKPVDREDIRPWCCHYGCRNRATKNIETAPFGPADSTQMCDEHAPDYYAIGIDRCYDIEPAGKP